MLFVTDVFSTKTYFFLLAVTSEMELMETDAMFLLRRLIGADSVQPRVPGGPRKLIRKFGKKGQAKGQFNMVCGVTLTKAGERTLRTRLHSLSHIWQ
jgi:hypothetical protein